MNVIFVCNKYSPAHFYTIESYKSILETKNVNCFLLEDYLINKSEFTSCVVPFITFSQIKLLTGNDLVFFFVSPNINNIDTIKSIKKLFPKAKTIYLYHEPLNKKTKQDLVKDRGFSFKTIKYIFGLSLFNGWRLVKHFDFIVLPSRNANEIFESNKKFKKKPHSVIHLLFKSNNLINAQKKYFLSYIGTAANNHGFIEFIQFLLSEHCSNSNKVLIATSSKLEKNILDTLQSKFEKNIEIHYGTFMSNEEISNYYSQTTILWLGYKHSAQSGVLPMSFMHGTPVICSNIDAFKEFAEEGTNCEYIDINNFSSIEEAIKKISSSYDKYKIGCINSYNQLFNPISKQDLVLNTFNSICGSN